MTVSFEGFPRTLERSALRPGRWFVAAEGMRPILCLATDIAMKGDLLALTFGAPKIEVVEVEGVPMQGLAGPFGSLEDEAVFAPGLTDLKPVLVAPARRPMRHGSLARLRSGDLGVGLGLADGSVAVVSLSSGLRSEGAELVFERWSLTLRRREAETLIGFFRQAPRLTEDRRRL